MLFDLTFVVKTRRKLRSPSTARHRSLKFSDLNSRQCCNIRLLLGYNSLAMFTLYDLSDDKLD